MRRSLAALAVGCLVPVLLTGACAAVAQAHATLDRSSPAAGATVATAPRQVDLYFSEAIADAGGSTFATVLDGGGRAVSGTARGDPADLRHLIVPLNATLDAGSYTVFWKTTSASDGGTTLGDFSFSVGNAAATPAATGGQVPVPDAVRSQALTVGGGSKGTAWLSGGLVGAAIGAGVTAAIFDIRARRRGGQGGNAVRRPPNRRR